MKKISEAEARKAVLEHVGHLDLKGWRYDLVELRRLEYSREWIAVFDTYDPVGALFDGPIAFVVDGSGIRDWPVTV